MAKFSIYRASTGRYQGTKNYTTLEQILQFIKENGNIIIEKNIDSEVPPCPSINWTKETASCDYQITIYDDYIE